MIDLMRRAGDDVRVFGSVARGADADGSDIDLLFTPRRPIDLMDLADLDIRLTELVGYPVEAVPDTDLRDAIRERVLAEAVPL
ncbi:nucleotidyltransferase domain-containing protein [Brachybacterium halotolerans subsp. kimchii]|uniref:nucleotidyltransferase family protein n=1 Tax=Brachybacterium halotolerans TaxID=2795215 RepID=UPI001E49E6A5|nr:nucleotidyltransferase domain-containing protein [Brachybacterium halotolerans]UEJ84263.1 nucleotidyltransferase domain-containing protein [Brachybacterium halotolerans subsp. kimchii]